MSAPAFPTGLFSGLTKRELFSAMVLQSLFVTHIPIATDDGPLKGDVQFKALAKLAVGMADQLLKALENKA